MIENAELSSKYGLGCVKVWSARRFMGSYVSTCRIVVDFMVMYVSKCGIVIDLWFRMFQIVDLSLSYGLGYFKVCNFRRCVGSDVSKCIIAVIYGLGCVKVWNCGRFIGSEFQSVESIDGLGCVKV